MWHKISRNMFHQTAVVFLYFVFVTVLAQEFSEPDPDFVFPTDRPPEKAEPAVWGDPAPDYSALVLDGSTTYLYTLIFVDSKITRHYNHEMRVVKQEILKMMKEVNEYLFQFNVRLSVVDVLETMRDDLSLYSFQHYHTQRIKQLPYHDFAALISFRYAGGLAYVGDMCHQRNVLLCGFYPHNPEAMGAIFFHEVAHLLGVPHNNFNDSINIENCVCSQKSFAQEILEAESYKPRVGCLKIPGFDHDCTAQYLANVLYKNRCLSREPRSNDDNVEDGYPDWSKAETGELSICGNGVVEEGEECDCGLPKFCKDSNCVSVTCKRKIPLFIFVFGAFFAGTILFTCCCIGCYYVSKKFISKVSLSSNRRKQWTISKFVCQPIKFFKRIVFLKNKSEKNKGFTNINKDGTETLISLTPEAMISATGTLKFSRPKVAPPPPPVISGHKTPRPNRPPPPPVPKLTPCQIPLVQTENSDMYFGKEFEDSISAKFADFDEEDFSGVDEIV